MKRCFGWGSILLLLGLLLLPAGLACVKVAEQPTNTTPPATQQGGNQPPVISDLSAANYQVYPSGTSELQVVVADPDGDKVSISWQATGGSINGSGYVVTWQAPKEYGNFTITAVASDGKGGSAQQSVDISVGANQSPQISSLVAQPQTVGFGGTSVITCIAGDPDGDAVSYTWQADEGNVTGVGPKVTWYAPKKAGSFIVVVKLTDSKGGESQGHVVITVAGTTSTVTLNLVQEETGTVSRNGDKNNAMMRAGDDDKNVGYRAFFTFNIFQLNRAEVKEAKLLFTTKNVIGDAFNKVAGLNGLMLRQVKFSGALPNWDATLGGTALKESGATLYAPPTVVDVTAEIVTLVKAAENRFQVMAAFDKIQNANDIAEWIEWNDVKLEVTFSEQ